MSTDCTSKRCTKCGEIKPLSDFYRRSKGPASGKYLSACKECGKAVAHQWNVENREKFNKNGRRFRASHPSRVRETNRRQYQTHKSERCEAHRQWRNANRDKVRDSNRRSKKAHPEWGHVCDHNRRLRKQGAEGHFTASDLTRQRESQKSRCYYCGAKVKLTIDHIIPLSRGGSNWPENIVLACGSCNSKKHSKLPHEWPDGGRLL